MQTQSGKLKAKLEQEAGITFQKRPDQNGLDAWHALDESGSIVASHRLLATCINMAAKELGE